MRITQKQSLLLFLTALLVLALNDHYLKYAFPGFFTGKLSDFVGIIAFYLFLTYLFPDKKFLHGIITILIFTWWKSPFSQDVILFLNSHGFFAIGRTIDYSDFWCLLVIPVIFLFISEINRPRFSSRFIQPLILVSAFIVLCSTTVMHSRPIYINTQYKIDKTPDEILKIWFEQDSVRDENIYRDTTNFRYNIHGQVYWIHQIYIPDAKTDTTNANFKKPLVSASITLLSDTLAISKKQTYVYFNYIYNLPFAEAQPNKVYKKWFKENYIEILK